MADPEIVAFFQKTQLNPREFLLQAVRNHEKQIVTEEKKQLGVDEIAVVVAEQNNNIMLKQSLVEALQKVNQLVSKISFHESEHVLAPFCAMAQDTQIHVCQMCNVFRVTTKKGLAAHQRKCGKTATSVTDA